MKKFEPISKEEHDKWKQLMSWSCVQVTARGRHKGVLNFQMKVHPARLCRNGDKWEWTASDEAVSPLYDRGVYIIVRINPNVSVQLFGLPFSIYGEIVYIGSGRDQYNTAKKRFEAGRPTKHKDDLVDELLQKYPNEFAIIHAFYNIPFEESRYIESIWQRQLELDKYIFQEKGIKIEYIPGCKILCNKRAERKYMDEKLSKFIKISKKELCKLRKETEQNKNLISTK